MKKWLPLVAVCLGTFMLLVDVTIVNVALPDMARNLSTSFASLQWVVDIYALVLAALLLGAGTIADRVGYRRTYIAGLGLFTLASLVCGLAPGSGLLIAARGIQGIGGAAMFAATFALLNSSFRGRDRGVAYGVWGAVSGAAAAVGPLLGGVLTEGLSWRWIFFVNLPIGLLATVLSLRVLTADRRHGAARLDLAGMASFMVFAAGLTYALIRANEDGWTAPVTLGVLVAAILGLVVFLGTQLRGEEPMLDLALLRRPAFVGVLIAGLLLNFAAFAYLAYMSLWLQSVLGMTPIRAGLTTLPLSAAAFIVSAAIGRHLHNSSPGLIIGGGIMLIGVGGIVSAMLVHTGSGWATLLPGLAIVGVGVGLATPTLSSTAMAAVPLERGGMAAGSVNTARQLGFALGIAVLGSVFRSRAAHVLQGRGLDDSQTAAALSGGQAPRLLAHAAPEQRAGLDHLLHQASAAGLDATMLVAGIAALLGGVVVLVAMRPALTAPSLDSADKAPDVEPVAS